MRTKTEMLDRIAEEYVCEAECIFSKLQELLRSETFSSDDMRALRDCAYTLGDFADEMATEFDYVLDDDNRFADRADEVM